MQTDHLVDSLFLYDNPNYTLDGQPIWRIIDVKELANVIARQLL